MNIFYQQKKNFPPLAWVADVKKSRVEVISGGVLNAEKVFLLKAHGAGISI